MSDHYPVSIKGVILSHGKILLVRNPRGELELPGGRLELGEEPRVTLVREITEELGIQVQVGLFISSGLFEVIPSKYVFIEAYICRFICEQEIALSNEHTEYLFLNQDEIMKRSDLPIFYKEITIRALENIGN